MQRIAIMQYLMEHPIHPSADDIYTALSPSMPTLSKTTVYNTLKLFSEQGAAQMLTIDEKNTNFDADTSIHSHFFDDERDLDKSTFTESLRITFKNNGKVSIKETLQDDATWSGEWEANGYDITIYANDLVLRGTVSKDYKTLELSSESISKVSWTGSRKLRLQ